MLENIKFKNGEIVTAEISFIGNICTIGATGLPADTSTIELVTKTGRVYGRYSGYSTVYRQFADRTQLSNDGSIWVDPPVPPEPEPVPYEPTIEDRVSDLEIAVCEITDTLSE